MTAQRSSASVSCCEDLFAEDVNVSGVVREFSKHLELQCPDGVWSSAFDDIVELEFGKRAPRLLTPLSVSLLDRFDV